MVGPVARIEAGTSRSAGRTNPARVKRGKRRPSLFCVCVLSIALCRLEKQGVGLVHGPIRGRMKEAWSGAHCSARSRRILPTSLTGDLTHHTSYCPAPFPLHPTSVPGTTLSFFQCSDDKCKKKLIWFVLWPWLVGVYNLIPRSCHQFDQEVFIYNT